MTRDTRIAVSARELSIIKRAKRDVYGDYASDVPHARFLVEAAKKWAMAQRLGAADDD